MDGNPAFTVHATAHAFRTAINLLISMFLLVMTTDLIFRKLFDLCWSDKLHVEMDLMWF